MNANTKSSKPTRSTKPTPKKSVKTLKPTSTTMSFTFALKLVKAIHLYLSNVWISLSGFLMALVQPMWLYFLSIPFASSTSSLDVESLSTPKTTPNYASMPLAHMQSSRTNGRKSKRSVTQFTSQGSTVLVQMEHPSPNLSTGPITLSNPKPRKRGPAQATSSPESGASSAAPKLRAAPAVTSTPSSPSKSSKSQPSLLKKKSSKSLEKPKTSARGQTTLKSTPSKKP